MKSLQEIQAELARRLTQPKSLESEGDSKLEGFDPTELKRSEETLYRKRRSQTRGMLPRTTQALGTNYAKLFRQYQVQHHFNGIDSIQRDAIAFADWLGECEEIEPWIQELARWEAIESDLAIHTWRLKFFSFAYPINETSTVLEQPNKESSYWIVWRVSTWRGKFRLWPRRRR